MTSRKTLRTKLSSVKPILFFVLAAVIFSAQETRAAKVLIVTDQAQATKAREVADLFRKTAPFSRMRDLEFKVIQTSVRKLGCQVASANADGTPATDDAAFLALSENQKLAAMEARERLAQHFEISTKSKRALPPSCSNKEGSVPSRLIACDTPTALSYLSALKKSESARYIVVVKTDSRYGGSGGIFPVITTGSPAAMAIHELMHQLGFADEYGYYNSCEADIYCDLQEGDAPSPSGYGNLPGSSFNVAMFNARASYSGNSDVRTRHGNSLPWLSSISSSTSLTTNSKLGTPQKGKTGIYRAIVCDNATKRFDTWQSTSEETIMLTLASTVIPRSYWPTIAKSLGAKLTLSGPNSQDVAVGNE